MRAMDSHHLLRHSKQQATQGLALAGVIVVLFGMYVAFAFAAPYYEKSVIMLSQLPTKQQMLTDAARNIAARTATQPFRAPDAPKPATSASVQLELQKYNLNGQVTVLVFAFAMYKLTFIISCCLMFIGGLMVWTSYHSWWSFSKRHGSAPAARAAVPAPVAVVRRKASR
jgi:hypothetical protein